MGEWTLPLRAWTVTSRIWLHLLVTSLSRELGNFEWTQESMSIQYMCMWDIFSFDLQKEINKNHWFCYVRTSNQEDFTWQEIWRTSIYLFKVRWSDHLGNYFPLFYRHGVNTNILHLTISRAEFYSFRITF